MSVFTEAQIQALAQELHQSEKSRVQIEHFSKRFPA
jgi:2-oxo-hept-3-ene-1,7-dioate hydratase